MWVRVWSLLNHSMASTGWDVSCRLFVQQKTGVKNWGQSDLGFVVSYMKGQVRQTKHLKTFAVWEASFLHEIILFTHVQRRRARSGLDNIGKCSVVGDCQVRGTHVMEDRQSSHSAWECSKSVIWLSKASGELQPQQVRDVTLVTVWLIDSILLCTWRRAGSCDSTGCLRDISVYLSE